MIAKITHCTLPVANQRDAVLFWTEKLGFKVAIDAPMPKCDDDEKKSAEPEAEQRWIAVSPPEQPDLQVVLQPPDWGSGDKERRLKRVGNCAGLILSSTDIAADFIKLQKNGVVTIGEPEKVPWGLSLMIKDQDGNMHNIVQPPSSESEKPSGQCG